MGDAREMNDHAGRPLRVKSGHVGAGRTGEEKIRAYSCKNIAAKFLPYCVFWAGRTRVQSPELEALVTPEKDRAANVRGVFASAGKVVAEDGFEPPTRGL